MKKIRELKENKIFKIVMKISRAFLFIILIAFVLAVYLQRFSDNKLSLFNFRVFTVVTGSMKPVYDVGDVLISKSVDPSTIKVGDTISYYGERGQVKDKVITHQVTKVVEENGEYYFHAKGLTNLVEDPVIYEDQIFGVVVYRSLILSTIYKIVSTKVGFYLLIIIPIMFIIGSEILTTLLEKEEERRKK